MTLNDKINLGESLAHTFAKVMLAHNESVKTLKKLNKEGISSEKIDLISQALRPSIIGSMLEIFNTHLYYSIKGMDNQPNECPDIY